ncbi:MAG: RNA polymerase III-inhibiting protein maf1 [Bogoriella megaspora]|nr:MAG: RNA polymerase III-inhibiting protein maf1 [Bogoriella megaspora]
MKVRNCKSSNKAENKEGEKHEENKTDKENEEDRYIASQACETIETALNFDTNDQHIVGGCDLYTTKAASSDKKLCKDLEKSLESELNEMIKLRDRWPDGLPQKESISVAIQAFRSSPFGNLSSTANRRAFAYVIATMNATHPCYDFTYKKPTDFHRIKSLSEVTYSVANQFRYLRPKRLTISGVPLASTVNASTSVWGPHMWDLLDEEMDLDRCSIYSPNDDPFAAEDPSLWSMDYFFYNKNKKRVCYFRVRGVSALSHPTFVELSPLPIRGKRMASSSDLDTSVVKRAKYWFGDSDEIITGGSTTDDDEQDVSYDKDGYDCPKALTPARYGRDYSFDSSTGYTSDYDDDYGDALVISRETSAVRAMSEKVARDVGV